MRIKIIILLAKQFWKNVFQQKAAYLLILIFGILVVYASYIGYKQMESQNSTKKYFQNAIRKSWESNPDKHPHRMAHYGSFALRFQHPLSLFDIGIDNFAGNAQYLEAHKQNSVIYSEASFSTGMLRFGDITLATLLQIVMPIILFFIGYQAIATDRENGTLKILISQGAGWKELLYGRGLGLFSIAACFVISIFVLVALLLSSYIDTVGNSQLIGRLFALLSSYLVFYFIISFIVILISAISKTSKESLIVLLSIWLLLGIVLPKAIHAIGSVVYPIPAKVDFESDVEKDILKQGDSHNPNDSFYKNFKDSVLRASNVDSIKQLNFNFGGLVGKRGEQLSAETYALHQSRLFKIYEHQIGFSRLFSLANPFSAIRHQSMVFSGTDFSAYQGYQNQAEKYRYNLAQTMNDLQIKYIPNNTPKEGSHTLHIDKKNWKDFSDFAYQYSDLSNTILEAIISSISLLFWFILVCLLINRLSLILKVV
jgi:ABC-2 type transport system permease protein